MPKHDASRVTFEEINKRLAYDRETGALTWKLCRNTTRIGKETKSLDASGYVQVNVQGTICKGHRLAWLLHYGELPNGHIDHINGVRHDNRIVNLRVVTNAINCQNKHNPLPSNKSGYMGVSFHNGRLRAHIQLNGKQHHLGTFPNAESAHAAYLEAKGRLHSGWKPAVDPQAAVDALDHDQEPRRHTIDDLKHIKTTYAAKAKALLKEHA